MTKRKTTALLALLLALVLLLQGCAVRALPPVADAAADAQYPTVEHPSYTPDGGFSRPEETGPVPFGEIEYVRPDTQALRDGFAAVERIVRGGAGATEILNAYRPVERAYESFLSMYRYTYIRYTLDLSDPFYAEEYAYLSEQYPLVEQAWENCFQAMMYCHSRVQLEERHFGEGFFTDDLTDAVFQDDAAVELLQRESALEIEYMALFSDMTVPWNGRQTPVNDLLRDETVDPLEVYRLYYETYAPQAAEIFAELIVVRRELAQALGYDSYADFAYGYYYSRDYTPAQAADYMAQIAAEMAPLAELARRRTGGMLARFTQEQTLEAVRTTAEAFGGEFAEACRFMLDYGLYDLSASDSKLPGSYVTYLPAQEMPFLYLSPTGLSTDYLTAMHEFGHFVQDYVNYGMTRSTDCAEVFSQGMELLSLNSPAFDPVSQRRMVKAKLADSIFVFLRQAAYAEFERRAYELPESELNLEGFNALMVECLKEYNLFYFSREALLAPGWMDIQHFFTSPFYVVSYCVSNDAALQLYFRDCDDGSGLATYRTLLAAAPGSGLLGLLEAAGLESPFADGHLSELAEYLLERLR